MTQKISKTFLTEVYSKAPKKSFASNKTDVFLIDDIWPLDILDLKDYCPENSRSYSYLLVVIDNFSKFRWTVLLKKNAQRKKDSFEKIFIRSKRKPKLLKTDRFREFYDSSFQNFLNNNNIKHDSTKTFLGAVFAERFNHTMRDLLKKVVFGRGDASRVDVKPKMAEKYKNKIHYSTKLTSIKAS